MTKSDQVVTPPQAGPAADPALLGNAGATADANEVGFNMAVNTMQKFGRELENLPTEGRRLVEQAISSVSTATANHRSTATGKSGSFERELSSLRSMAQQDAFVRIANTLVDMTPSTVPVRALVDTLVLSSIVLTVFSISSLIGGYLLAPMLTVMIPPVGAAILSALVVPAALYLLLSRGYGPIDGFWLIVQTGLAQGVLSGAALANLTVYAEPFIAISSIASAFTISLSQQKSRSALLGITIATSLSLHITLGAIEGALSPVYLTLTALYTLATLMPIQLAARDQKRSNVNLYSAVLVGMSVAAKLMVYGMLGAGPIIKEIAVKGAEGPEGMAMEQVVNA